MESPTVQYIGLENRKEEEGGALMWGPQAYYYRILYHCTPNNTCLAWPFLPNRRTYEATFLPVMPSSVVVLVAESISCKKLGAHKTFLTKSLHKYFFNVPIHLQYITLLNVNH